MVVSLFCAENELNDDIIISYADIIYEKNVLKKLMEDSSDLAVVVDKDWERLWRVRMDDPLSDAETLKVNEQGNISELGKKPNSINDIQGQYMGLIKIKKNILKDIVAYYHSLDKNAIYDTKTFDNMFMTSFLQMIIHHRHPIKPIFINGGWLEIDSVEDLERYQRTNYKIQLTEN